LLFNSFIFLFAFLPAALAAVLFLRRFSRSAGKLALVLLSLVFYGWGAPRQIPMLVASLAFTWIVGAFIGRARDGERPRAVMAWLTLGVGADAALLIWFKYAPFVAGNLDAAFGTGFHLGPFALPLAISFFTFQEIAYLVDTARGETGRMGALDFAVFTTFYPKLIAGPIVRFKEFAPQLQTRRFGKLIGPDILVGLVIVSIGLFKKTVIADTLSPYTAVLFTGAKAHTPSMAVAWLATLAFTLQVYFDFSGYSDMAIGLGRMFGIKLPLNFHSPFRAQSIIEYWRRWHMTLQRFVVSYIFQPLSLPLNRLSAQRGLRGWSAFFLGTAFPIFTAFLVLGIWHGAGWTFVVFGALHGLYVGTNEAWREFGKQRRRRIKRAGGTVRDATVAQRLGYHALTLCAVLAANAMFRAPNVDVGLRVWRGMIGLGGVGGAMPTGVDWGLGVTLVAALALVFLFPNTQQIMGRFHPAWNFAEWRDVGRPPIAWTWKPSAAGLLFAAAALFLGVMFIQSGRAVFLYFNF
jgi:alginate O-acetyltransferase complex protein AlgI